LCLHLLRYPGITGFNSFYDRDEGPVGGLREPPPAGPWLLPISLTLKAAGLILALAVGPSFAAIYVAFIVLSFLYSHPLARWKANPWLSALIVSGGQGGLGFLAGWVAARGEIGSAWSQSGIRG